MARVLRSVVTTALAILVIVAVWEGYKWAGQQTGGNWPGTGIELPVSTDDIIMPHVSDIAAELVSDIRDGRSTLPVSVFLLKKAWFTLQEAAIGSVFWHDKGWVLYRVIERYMRRRLEAAGYVEVKTPQLVDRALWEMSGHWDKFRENMFVAEVDEGKAVQASESRAAEGSGARADRGNDTTHHLALKPMNCPCHVQIFRSGNQELPRPAAAHGRVRLLPPQRAFRCPTRPDAVRAFIPGRTPISSAPRTRSPAKPKLSVASFSRSTRISALPMSA